MLPAVSAALFGAAFFVAGICECYHVSKAYWVSALALVGVFLVCGLCMGVQCIVTCISKLASCCLPTSVEWLVYFVFWFLLFGVGVSLPASGLSGTLVADDCSADSRHELCWWLSCSAWTLLPIYCVYSYAKARKNFI